MTSIRRSVVFAVLVCSCMVSAAQLGAQTTPQEWASAAALGDVFVGTQDTDLVPLIKVFGHGCTSPPPAACTGRLKEQIRVGPVTGPIETGTIRGFAFDTTPQVVVDGVVTVTSRYDLYVAVDTGKIWRVQGTLVSGSHPVQLVVNTSSDIRQIKFDEDRNLYVSYGGMSPKIERRAPPDYDDAEPVTHLLDCDVTLPAPGVWFDLSARTLPSSSSSAKQFAVYACGGTQVRWVDVLSTPPAPPRRPRSGRFRRFPTSRGTTRPPAIWSCSRPIKSNEESLHNNSELDNVFGAQGGLVIAYGTNLEWLNRFGAVKRQLRFWLWVLSGGHLVERDREPHGRLGVGCGGGHVIPDALSTDDEFLCPAC